MMIWRLRLKAMNSPEAEFWRAAEQKELKSLKEKDFGAKI
jgi:hypothetical protein